jgi:phospholipid/cholesterol/gamma-HCH transport system substrate-binding protein
MIREEDTRFQHLHWKIGLFIVIALAGVAVSVVLFGMQKDLFTKKYNLHFTVDRGTGFTKGMPVKLSGFRIGRVTSIALNNQAMVDISVEIDSRYSKWIRSDSTVKLSKEGLVGDNIVELSVSSSDKHELKDNDPILYIKTKALDELADEIATNVKPVLSEIAEIISYINDPEGDLKKSIRNLEQLTRNLEETRQNADTLLITASGNIDRLSNRTALLLDTSYKKIDSIDLAPTLSKVHNTLDYIDNKLPLMMGKIDVTLENVTKISAETKTLTENAFPRIPGLLSQAEDVMLSTDRLINSINNIWLFKDSTTPAGKQQKFIRGDSYE